VAIACWTDLMQPVCHSSDHLQSTHKKMQDGAIDE
jgi:hypothetical protein